MCGSYCTKCYRVHLSSESSDPAAQTTQSHSPGTCGVKVRGNKFTALMAAAVNASAMIVVVSLPLFPHLGKGEREVYWSSGCPCTQHTLPWLTNYPLFPSLTTVRIEITWQKCIFRWLEKLCFKMNWIWKCIRFQRCIAEKTWWKNLPSTLLLIW